MTASATATATTPLEERLMAIIRENGPLRVGDFMSDALCHPQYGYYSTQDPFGREGDFTTAPEISQVFGELIGAWLVDSWMAMGSPSLFQLVELGPGRGTLMADILRVGALRPDFLKAARITLLENSGRMRLKQRHTLNEHLDQIRWVESIEDVPAGPFLLVANEFLDCLPIRQFVRTTDTGEEPWRERLVGLSEVDQFCYVLSDKKYGPPAGAPAGAKPEDIFETSPQSDLLIQQLADRMAADKGRALFIDYGHGRPGFGDTLQAVKRQDYWHPLARPGFADITAHVDFSAIARAGRSSDLRVDGPVPQGAFLARLGLGPRTEALGKATDDAAQREHLISGTKRLIAPEQMGQLFKVLTLSSPSLPEPPGFR